MDMNARDETPGPLAPAVIITGATQGIGRALADEFAKGGHTLLLVARTEATLAKAASEITARYKVPVHYVACDLSTGEGCDQVAEALRRRGLYCESLVNNAAIMMAGFFQEQDEEKLLKLVDLNVRAVVALTRRFLPDIRVPALLVHALDDPWIPADAYTSFDWSSNRRLVPLLAPGGGHVGFHGRGSRTPWHDRCLRRFLEAL